MMLPQLTHIQKSYLLLFSFTETGGGRMNSFWTFLAALLPRSSQKLFSRSRITRILHGKLPHKLMSRKPQQICRQWWRSCQVILHVPRKRPAISRRVMIGLSILSLFSINSTILSLVILHGKIWRLSSTIKLYMPFFGPVLPRCFTMDSVAEVSTNWWIKSFRSSKTVLFQTQEVPCMMPGARTRTFSNPRWTLPGSDPATEVPAGAGERIPEVGDCSKTYCDLYPINAFLLIFYLCLFRLFCILHHFIANFNNSVYAVASVLTFYHANLRTFDFLSTELFCLYNSILVR